MDKVELGSQTAKNGFKNEDFAVATFNAWETNELARAWLLAMGYNLNEIEFVKAQKIKGQFKADIQVSISVQIKLKSLVDIQNIQVKLVSNPRGFNQIDKRWLKSYNEIWQIPQHIYELLALFTGELPPRQGSKNKKRMFVDEFSDSEQNEFLKWFKDNQAMILCDILKGRGQFASEWFLVILRISGDVVKWVLKPINEVINFYNGEVCVSKQGSIKFGKITIQRKGGDGGRDTAKMLQFKINPCLLFDI
ncbi:type II restriction endonuclease, HinP1I family [Campylobacter iguaniorum]|uniref:Type II restriction endonuclease, HinP1I family n=1 Tax=Campylobacter iguaniorum TaxID=1244531 RepID=A0A076FBX1_9BACT|nr:type II R-M system restriction endonuclease [Campylobacter iguaniorum]AII15441.1 type II restriction endonuclease, HinP1I family [Campylobacter iguaniorum]